MIDFPIRHPQRDNSQIMHATAWKQAKKVELVEIPKPVITEETDAILRVTLTAICGSDLHMYHNDVTGMHKGDIIGHEFMGIVEDVGQRVTKLKKGDKVVVAFSIACGQCSYCQQELFSVCDRTNPSKVMENLYGHRTCGIFGYSHLTGGYDGGQAQFARVPIADVKCLKVPMDIPDEKLLFLSDIGPTALHGCVLAGVKPGDTVGIFGSGPVGLLTILFAKHLGAKRKAQELGAETINFACEDSTQRVQTLVPGGFDCTIDAVGLGSTKSVLHNVERFLHFETDSPVVVNEAIHLTKKGGRIGIVGAYVDKVNHFSLGAFMEKGLSMAAGQCPVQKYWHEILDLIQNNKIELDTIISHRMPLTHVAQAYYMFDKKLDDCIKVVLTPWNK